MNHFKNSYLITLETWVGYPCCVTSNQIHMRFSEDDIGTSDGSFYTLFFVIQNCSEIEMRKLLGYENRSLFVSWSTNPSSKFTQKVIVISNTQKSSTMIIQYLCHAATPS